ncbi:hypothetical protein D3C80_1854860 [compost metagenome]
MQLLEHSGQFLNRNVKQHGIGENAVEAFGRQVEFEKVLLPDLTAAVIARHLGKPFTAVEANGNVPHGGEGFQVTARPTAKIEQGERCRTLNMP